MSFEVPMTLVGFTTLSELVNITVCTSLLRVASIMFCTPLMLVCTASNGDCSHKPTCL